MGLSDFHSMTKQEHEGFKAGVFISFILWFCISLFLILVVHVGSWRIGYKDCQREAIKNGCGVWVTNDQGNPEFAWAKK